MATSANCKLWALPLPLRPRVLHPAPAAAPALAHSWSSSGVPPPHPIAPITRPPMEIGTAPVDGNASPRDTAGTADQNAGLVFCNSTSSRVLRRKAAAATAFAREVSVVR